MLLEIEKTRTMKKLLLPILLFVSFASFAQDRIFQSNGNVIDAKIKSIDNENIVYWHWNNLRGSLYVISVQEVDKVKYENGREEVFAGMNNNEHPIQRPMHPVYKTPVMGKRILALSPMYFTENGVGVAFSYEKGLDPGGIISFTLPVAATFNLNTSTETAAGKNEDAMVYVMPGIKFYPTSNRGVIKYAVGPSLVLGGGQKTTGGDKYFLLYNYYSEPYVMHAKLMMGVMVDNSLNISPTEHLYMGVNFGFGFTYINRLDGTNFGTTGIVQGGFKLGYRF